MREFFIRQNDVGIKKSMAIPDRRDDFVYHSCENAKTREKGAGDCGTSGVYPEGEAGDSERADYRACEARREGI